MLVTDFTKKEIIIRDETFSKMVYSVLESWLDAKNFVFLFTSIFNSPCGEARADQLVLI